MDTNETQQHLIDLGFLWTQAKPDNDYGPNTQQAVARFQSAYCGPPIGGDTAGWLTVDGQCGPATSAALEWVVTHGNRLSTFFTADETRCRHCGQNFVRRELLSALETLRAFHGSPVSVLDICRCAAHNAAVGGAHDSQHLLGSAVDPATAIGLGTAVGTAGFSGIGWKKDAPNLVCHLDVRHIFGDQLNNPTKSSIAHPARFAE